MGELKQTQIYITTGVQGRGGTSMVVTKAKCVDYKVSSRGERSAIKRLLDWIACLCWQAKTHDERVSMFVCIPLMFEVQSGFPLKILLLLRSILRCFD